MGLPEFNAYQQHFRAGGNAGIKADWNAKGQKGKVAWTKAYKPAQAEQARIEGLHTAADTARNALDRDAAGNLIIVRTFTELQGFSKRVNDVQKMYQELKPECAEVARLWQELATVENGRPNVNVASQAGTHLLEANAEQRIVDCETEIDRLMDRLDVPPVPQDPLFRQRMPAHWDVVGRHGPAERFMASVERGRDDGRPGLPGAIWKCAARFGGGQSTGALWVRFDEDTEQVVQRVFRKDVLLGERDWFDPTKWEGDVRSMNNKLPYELVITNAMANVQWLDHTVRMHVAPQRAHVDDANLTYKLYLEWADKGNLQKLISEHKKRDVPIPEPMIWYTAEALALAGNAMLNGSVPDADGEDDPQENWLEIVHRDIKPLNIFLESIEDDDEEALYPDYDRPLLGDYGLAVKTHADDDFNPRWYNYRTGTPGFRAPEQMRHINAQTKEVIDARRLGEKTNVFGVGAVLYCMIMNVASRPEPGWTGNPDLDTSYDYPAAQQTSFSVQLRDMVTDCLRYDPARRPTFAEMLARIDQATDENGSNLAVGMRSGNVTPAVRARQMPWFVESRYQLDMTPTQIGGSSI